MSKFNDEEINTQKPLGVEKNNSFLLNQNYSNKLNSNPLDVADGTQSESVVGSMLINPKIDLWLFPIRAALLIADVNKNFIKMTNKWKNIENALRKLNDATDRFSETKSKIKQNSYT